MRKFLNIAIAFMLLLAPLVNFDNSENTNMSSNLEFFGSQAGDDCENETKDEDLPYYVNKDSGSDDNVGSEDCPFATISKAAESITDGDTVIISHGIYRESVSIDGIEDVTFRAAEGSKVVIDGSSDIEEDLGGVWEEYQDGIYRTNVSKDAWQLFVDFEEMVPARWPNANFVDGSVFNRSLWAEGSMDRDKYKNEDGDWVYPYDNGELIDISGLNETGFDPTGAIAILNVGSFKTWSRNITEYDSENNSFKFDDVSNWKTKHHAYFLEGKLELIDTPSEWFFDNKNNTLYFFPPEGLNLTEANIRAKTQAYGFSSDNADGVTLENIDFFANTFQFNKCENCVVSGSNLLYPSTSKRSLNIAGEDIEERWVSRFDKSSNCVVDGSAFLYTDGTAIEFHGGDAQSHNNTINNSYFYHIDWSVSDMPGLMVTIIDNGRDNVFSNNTIHLTGASATLSIGDAPTVMYNEVWNTGLLQTDGAVVQMMMAEQEDANIAYNWIHDTGKYGIRMDGPMGGTNEGRNATVHHNVLWNMRGALMVKGDYHITHNNTIFGDDQDKNNIIVLFESGFGNENSTTEFNAADKIAGHRSDTYEEHPVPGNYSDNFNGYIDEGGSVESQLIDPENYDFRPKTNSAIANKSAGAYGPNDDWVAGITWYFLGPELPFEGCMDEDAKNYEQRALFSDGSCEYYVEGCMDPDAKNYNSEAEVDDGSCEYYVEGCMDVNATNYNSEAEIDDGSCEYPEPIEGCMDVNATNYDSEAEVDDDSCEYPEPIEGCMDMNATNYNSTAEVDDGTCQYPEPIEGCMDVNATNYDSEAEVDDSSCEYPEPIKGCMDTNATNYNSIAEVDDGSCEYPVPEPIEGCTNETANNFNSTAEVDDGSCDFTEEKLDYCPAEITEENEGLIDDVCVVPTDETEESGNDNDEGFLPSVSLFVSFCVIAIIAFRRR